MDMELEQKHKIIAGAGFITAAAMLIFWLGYYIVGSGLGSPGFYGNYPGAFPFPDIVLATLLIIGGVQILRQHRLKTALTIINSVLLVYLGVLGFALPLENGPLLIAMTRMLSNGFVNLWFIVFGFYFLLKTREAKGGKRGKRKTVSE